MNVEWTRDQQAAMRLVEEWRRTSDHPYFVLGGYAGTGKTTLARHLAEGVRGSVHFAAYTGKAADVLRRTGIEASTIHKLVYLPLDKCEAHLVELEAELASLRRRFSEENEEVAEVREKIRREKENLRRPEFTLNMDSPLWNAALVVVDEYSMIDRQVGEDLLSFGCPVLALGDPGQLPPVKGGRYFGEPDYVLTEICRQAEGDPIVSLSRDVREGRPLVPGTYGKSRVLCRADLSKKDLEEMVLGADQVLVGLNATRRQLNREMREALGRKGPHPVRGDKLVCLRNNPQEGLFNGQMWRVRRVGGRGYLRLDLENDERERVSCLAHREHFEGHADDLNFRERRLANEFDYGYALTVHKAQGSEWGSVLVYDEWWGTDRQKWLYTALTRASESVTVLQ